LAEFFLRPFIDLLPYRIDQALADHVIGRSLRVWRVRRSRAARPRKSAIEGGIPGERRRLYVDLAVISRNDAGTGIQRVVRALALALIEAAPEHWDVRFVTAFRHSAYHCISWPANGARDIGDMIARPGDVFLGLDFSLDAVRRHRRQLGRFRRDGGRLWFLVCDLLPVQRPEWFSPNNVVRYKAWLEAVAAVAEGFFCISHQTETELQTILQARFDLFEDDHRSAYQTCVIPMGHDIRKSVVAANAEAEAAPRFDMAAPFTLMVGTLEPRKGHSDILAAFDVLWRRGAHDRLVLVGRMGWRVEDLRSQILDHPAFGDMLLWFDDVGDGELQQIYRACQGMIIASHAEGFGLPLIEALGHHKPVLARDLAIFRQHEALGVHYFPASGRPEALADCIRSWIDAAKAGSIVVTPPNTDWNDSAQVILATLGTSKDRAPAPSRT
jgi:glycosyltransferase involved in cell wall biosynthesis